MKMMVIYQDGIPVGLSFPKKSFIDSEKENFRLDGDNWYKIGSIVILDKYRNKGIGYKACKEFLKLYPKIFYHVDEKNIASVRVAEKLKLNFSHMVTLNEINYRVYKSI
jgi:RimJ/RimL family protein N-acetyltransferase